MSVTEKQRAPLITLADARSPIALTEEAKNRAEKGSSLKSRRNVARDVGGLHLTNAEGLYEAFPSNRRSDKGRIVAKSTSISDWLVASPGALRGPTRSIQLQ